MLALTVTRLSLQLHTASQLPAASPTVPQLLSQLPPLTPKPAYGEDCSAYQASDGYPSNVLQTPCLPSGSARISREGSV